MSKVHYADDYLFNMQDWNPELAKEGFKAIYNKNLKPMARLCDGKHSKLNDIEPTFLEEEVTCKNCLKKIEKINLT